MVGRLGYGGARSLEESRGASPLTKGKKIHERIIHQAWFAATVIGASLIHNLG